MTHPSKDGQPVLRAGPAPHWSSPVRRRHLNLALIIGLVPTVVAAASVFGWAAVAKLAFAAGMAVCVELVTQRLFNQPNRIGDLSALAQGLLLAMLLPPTAPFWLVAVGAAVMIVVGKQLFGGVGGYPLNPVLMAWAVLLLSWPNRVFPIGDPGLIGAASASAVYAGGALLIVTGHVRWQAPAGMFIGVALAAHGLGALFPDVAGAREQLLTGSAALGILFLSTDSTCSPANALARVLFGFGAGVLLVMLRLWGTWPEPVPFALLLMNLTSPLLDRIRPRPFGKVVGHG